MNKPGCHRTGLDAHFGGGTSMLRNASRNWPGIGGADAAPEPLALLVDNAGRGRLLRYVQPNIMRHRNLRWCKSPGKMPGSRHYRLLGFEPRLPEVHTIKLYARGSSSMHCSLFLVRRVGARPPCLAWSHSSDINRV